MRQSRSSYARNPGDRPAADLKGRFEGLIATVRPPGAGRVDDRQRPRTRPIEQAARGLDRSAQPSDPPPGVRIGGDVPVLAAPVGHLDDLDTVTELAVDRLAERLFEVGGLRLGKLDADQGSQRWNGPVDLPPFGMIGEPHRFCVQVVGQAPRRAGQALPAGAARG
jgi:hypothetical protein